MSSCVNKEQFEFGGTTVGFTYCSSMGDVRDAGYFIKLDYPKGIGGTITQDGNTMDNVIIIYQTGRILKNMSKVSGKIFMSENYSEANCLLINNTDWDLPEAVVTDLDPIK